MREKIVKGKRVKGKSVKEKRRLALIGLIFFFLFLTPLLSGCTQPLTTQTVQTAQNAQTTSTQPNKPSQTALHDNNSCNFSKIEVYFYYSPECPHCERVKPYVDALREKYENVTFYYCNVDEEPSEACYNYAYYVAGVPTVVVHSGNLTVSLVGERDVTKLGELLEGLACCGS